MKNETKASATQEAKAGVRSVLRKWIEAALPQPAMAEIKEWHYYRKLRRSTPFDEPDLLGAMLAVRPGDCVLDIGANFGLYTRWLSQRVGPQGRVFSAEPVPETYALLSANVRHQRLGNVRCANVAVSDREGRVTMEIPTYRGGGENFYQARIIGGDGDGGFRRVSARTATLDRLTRGFDRIDFVKCDVEGHEGAVLRGALRVLGDHRPIWLIEVSGAEAERTFSFMARYGYAAFAFDGQKFVERNAEIPSVNYFFLRPEHRRRLIGEAANRSARVPVTP